jgi:long-chain acyl-CoA synthetase
MSGAVSLPGLLEELASRRPRGVAFRQKRLGIWREISWGDYAEQVRSVALALDEMGVGAGDRVAVFADNEPRWLIADLGIQAVGAASVGIYPALDAADAASAIARSGARIVFCGDQEQVDKLLERWEDVPALEALVAFDLKGLHTPEYAEVPLEPYEELLARGRALLESRASRYGELLSERGADEVATVAFTSGTTGPVRGFLLGQGGEMALAQLVASSIELTEKDSAYSLLPLGHATARLFDAYAPLVAGSSLSFAESLETVPTDMIEAAPTVLVATPRLLERVRGDVELRMEHAGRFKRGSYRWAIARLTKAADARIAGRRGATLGAWLGRRFVAGFIKRQAGLGRLRYAGVSGSFVAPDSLKWFWALGVPFHEQYGQVETGGIVTSQRGERDLGTAGPPVDPAVELRLEGEDLLVRGSGLAVAALDGEPVGRDDGWYDTGDLAKLDSEGRLVPIGRRAHVLRTASGDDISPAEIESALKSSPYVRSAMVVAAGRPFVTAVVELNEDAVGDWARRRGISVSTYAALAENADVVQLLEADVRTASDGLPTEQRILAFRILTHPLRDELTPTGKIRRAVVERRYSELIDEMYAEHALTRRTTGVADA